MEPQRDPENLEPEHLAAIAKLADARVLEIGSGNGRLTRRYGNLVESVVGIDSEAGALSEAIAGLPSQGRLTFDAVLGSADMLPFKAESFDAAVFAWSL